MTTIRWIEPQPLPDDGDTKEFWILPPQIVEMFHEVSHKKLKVERGSVKHRVMKTQGWVELEAGQGQS